MQQPIAQLPENTDVRLAGYDTILATTTKKQTLIAIIKNSPAANANQRGVMFSGCLKT